MPNTLYQKYRPRTFSEIAGQDWISRVLKKVLSEGKNAHAYLFTGPRGTGKTSTARIVAKALNCQNLKDGEPCNKCAACVAINEGRFLDLFEIDAASNRGIDEIRELKERVNFAPAEGKTKVYIIDETHMLTTEAFNALLKTLEEPPSHTVFILATTEPHKLPLTIISRTQRFDFKLANEEELKKRIKHILSGEKVKIEDEALELIIQGGGGSFRDTETILEKVIRSSEIIKDKKITLDEVREILGLSGEKSVIDMMKFLLNCDLDNSLKLLAEIQKSGASLVQFVRQLLEFGRTLIHHKINSKDHEGVGEYSFKDLVKIIKVLSECAVAMKTTVIQILPLELAIVDICVQGEVSKEVVGSSETESRNGNEELKKNEVEKNLDEVRPEQDQKIQDEESHDKDDEKPATELKKVKKLWGKFLEKIRPHNNHLQAFLSKAEPSEIRGEKIILKVPFRFHKSRIEEHKSKKIISEVFNALLNVSLVPSCIIEEGLRPKVEIAESNADLVEEVFGDMLEEDNLKT